MHDSRVLSGSVLVICAALIGSWVSLRSWDGISYYYLDSDKRHPAAVRKVFDFSHLEGSALELASQKRLLSDARVVAVAESQDLGVELGHFITRGEAGGKQFACHAYDRVELTFYAEGMAIAGEKPLMIVEADCRIGDDINRISAIPIPVSKILQENPGELELQYMEENPVLIRFDHVAGQWPREWTLFSVKLYNQRVHGQELFIDNRQVQEISAKNSIKMTW
ncbi:MAG: hypothetical protein H6624_13110 [Bdellovibrionaceae bacterium]|nr:hypothetical protein [Bdellovibrionales bacterium]MCB9085281.1 hypothetical protein [Pseudobdellovibrionaceae bacterium]